MSATTTKQTEKAQDSLEVIEKTPEQILAETTAAIRAQDKSRATYVGQNQDVLYGIKIPAGWHGVRVEEDPEIWGTGESQYAKFLEKGYKVAGVVVPDKVWVMMIPEEIFKERNQAAIDLDYKRRMAHGNTAPAGFQSAKGTMAQTEKRTFEMDPSLSGLNQ